MQPQLSPDVLRVYVAHELRKRELTVETEVAQPVFYGGQRLNMLVENCIIIENKAVETVLPIHQAQLLTYMRLRKSTLGYLINWHVLLIKDGIQRMKL